MDEEPFSIITIYGSNLFSNSVMRERLPRKVFEEIRDVQKGNIKLTSALAENIAVVMKEWALEKGATHYTHWFQPLTGSTAEKHDSFIEPSTDGNVFLDFKGKSLLQGEPDASSFPSGGLRETFEARGYTAWDTTSPAFIREEEEGSTLVIPTAFISYLGHALDTKTPLLKSMKALNDQTMRVLHALGNRTSKSVVVNVGPEQEYFLVDRKYYEKRPDLLLTGRTVFGSMPAKGQELDDHYFGAINNRVKSFMHDLNIELWKLGISAKTQHNEVAPNQFELANIYNSANIATDNNQIEMEIMKKIAGKHGLVCLLHEKPFRGVNGSGKHNNWSIGTNDGINLLEPGDNPHENMQFLLFLMSVIEAVDTYAPLLRASTASSGNDHRLGGNEAPPSIISVFLGDALTTILKRIAAGKDGQPTDDEFIQIGTSNLPSLNKDDTDRNRTSPFAFTGNRFEFRMVPSSGSIADANITLNTTVAEVLSKVADRLEVSKDIEADTKSIIQDSYNKHHRIIFNGDGYTQEWAEEAEKRGLCNFPTTIDVLPELQKQSTVSLYENQKVLSKMELDSRYNVFVEKYTKEINIEAAIMVEISKLQIIPAAVSFAGDFSGSLVNSKKIIMDLDISTEKKLLSEIHKNISGLLSITEILDKQRNTLLESNEEDYQRALQYKNKILPLMEEVREYGDALEKLVSKEYWPIPTYEEMLFKL
ncbi:MAG: glutamine synthetase III [Spirochaetia bacterium]|jgi:glutamine synthetase|nr:glutamine synthetase III [Spirochaetia bacterium]